MYKICQMLHIYFIYNIKVESYSSKNLIYLYYKVDKNSKLYNQDTIFKFLKKKYNLLIVYKNLLTLKKKYNNKIKSSQHQLYFNHYNKIIKKNNKNIDDIKSKLNRIEYHENLLLNIYKK